jgi:hypothetical protein
VRATGRLRPLERVVICACIIMRWVMSMGNIGLQEFVWIMRLGMYIGKTNNGCVQRPAQS